MISEYVDVADAFFDEREKGFVNGLLDAVAKDVRGKLSASPHAGAGFEVEGLLPAQSPNALTSHARDWRGGS